MLWKAFHGDGLFTGGGVLSAGGLYTVIETSTQQAATIVSGKISTKHNTHKVIWRHNYKSVLNCQVTQLLWKRKLLSVSFGCWGNYLQGGLSTGGTVNGGSYTWSVREGTIYGGEGGYPWYVIKLWTRKVSNQNIKHKNKSIRFLSQYKKWLPPKQVFATAACQTNKLTNIWSAKSI